MKRGANYGYFFWAWLENEHPIADAVLHGLLLALALAAIIHEFI